eukprot:15430809-Alexandrium_andersonii.AAC.1
MRGAVSCASCLPCSPTNRTWASPWRRRASDGTLTCRTASRMIGCASTSSGTVSYTHLTLPTICSV